MRIAAAAATIMVVLEGAHEATTISTQATTSGTTAPSFIGVQRGCLLIIVVVILLVKYASTSRPISIGI